MEKSDLDRLLERYLTGEVTEQEKKKIEVWLNILKTGDTSNPDLSKADEDKLFKKIMAGQEAELEPGRETGFGSNRWLLRVAASLLFVLAISYSGWYLLNRNSGSQPTSPQGVEKMILNDGTLVWLRGNSKLAYYEKKGEGVRYAEFTGNALFEVAKDPLHPFVIQCGDVKLKVLGTSFNIKADKEGLELKVLTGRVNVSTDRGQPAIDVEPNEKVIYKVNRTIEKFSLEKQEVASITASTEYMMQFSNTTLKEVIDGIGKKFNVGINLSDDQAGKCRITADFTDHSLESSLQMITEMLDVDYTRTAETITINGKGCN